MVTLDELCAELERSGHPLTRRSARDWWTKGLLPGPQRRSLGRPKGPVTFWNDPGVIAQAQAAYELLAQHGRTYTALISLWLLNFPVDLARVRDAWEQLADQTSRQINRDTHAD